MYYFATLFVSVDTTPHWLFSRGFCYASFACAVPPRNLIDSQMVSASLCSQRRATSCAQQGRCHCGSRVEIWPLYTICTWGLAIARMPPRGVQQRFCFVFSKEVVGGWGGGVLGAKWLCGGVVLLLLRVPFSDIHEVAAFLFQRCGRPGCITFRAWVLYHGLISEARASGLCCISRVGVVPRSFLVDCVELVSPF